MKSKPKTLSDITSHKFYAGILESMSSIYSIKDLNPPKGAKEFKKWQRAGWDRLTHSQKYQVRVFHRLSNLSNVVDRLAQSRQLLNRYSKSFFGSRLTMSRNDWTNYHFFVHTTSLASYFDCLLLLAGQIFYLGLPDKQCTEKRIVKHKFSRRLGATQEFNAIKKVLKQHFDRRHRYVHRGEESSLEDLKSTGELISLRTLTFLADHKSSLLPKTILTDLWRARLKEIAQLLAQTDEQLYTHTCALLDKLSAYYDALTKHLSTQSPPTGAPS